MNKNVRLTDLITQDPPNKEKLSAYGRSRKGLGNVDLFKLAVLYHVVKKKYSCGITPLHVACFSGAKPKVVRILVEEGSNVNDFVAPDVGSPLAVSLGSGNISIAKLLIDLGGDVNKVYDDWATPICYAIEKKEKKEKTCVAAVKLLLESGVSVNTVANQRTGERPIHMAVDYMLPSVVSLLLQKGADVNVIDVYGHSPIHNAVERNRTDLVKLLLLHDVDMYLENLDLETPLLLAVEGQYGDVVKELVQAGCDINRPISDGSTAPLHSAVYWYKMEMIKLLISLGADVNKDLPLGVPSGTPLHVVAKRHLHKTFAEENSEQRKEMAEYLVENGAKLNMIDSSNKTPLQAAIDSGFLSLSKFFIRLGADFNTKNRHGDTIFHQVVKLNRDIIILLLEFGGDYQAYNNNKLTPYHLAISKKVDLKYIKSFVKHGCPYDQESSGWTNLFKKNKSMDQFIASEKKFFKGIRENNLKLVEIAVTEGAVPSSCCEDMKYPLHYVAFHGYNDLLLFLLERNVNVNKLNDQGKTPLHLAASKGHHETCRILLRYGACYNYRSQKCPNTPRMIASERKHTTVVELLDGIHELFVKARSEKNDVIDYLKCKLENSFEFLICLNVTNFRGDTVVATALKSKKNVNAEKILKMKLEFNLRSSK